jgi:hypothetical protein
MYEIECINDFDEDVCRNYAEDEDLHEKLFDEGEEQ